jgi:hypothetical protein
MGETFVGSDVAELMLTAGDTFSSTQVTVTATVTVEPPLSV